jgi:hypothetical protein
VSLNPTRRFGVSLTILFLALTAAFLWTPSRAWGIGFMLGESKEQLKLQYDLSVSETVSDADRGIVLVTVEFSLADEGRLKPLDDVQLIVMRREPFKEGGYGADLVTSINLKPAKDGKSRVGRVQLVKDLAERAEINLNTHTLDGKTDRMTRLHHVIKIGKLLRQGPAAQEKKS